MTPCALPPAQKITRVAGGAPTFPDCTSPADHGRHRPEPIRSESASPRRTLAQHQAFILSVYALKPLFQALLRPVVVPLPKMGVTANAVTVSAALGSIGVGLAVGLFADRRTVFLLVPAWLLVRMALNAIDGMIAREFSQQSTLGGYLNELGDVVSDAALYAPFALAPPFAWPGIALIIALSIVTELAGVLGLAAGGVRRYDGPMGKSDRAVVFGALGLFIGTTDSSPDALQWAVPAISVLLLVTILNRVRAGVAAGDGQRLQPHQSAAAPAVVTHGRHVEEKTFQTHDGVELFYRHWPAAGRRRGAIVLFHRGHEHSGRMAHLVDELDLPEFDFFAWDARGQGRSPGARGFSPSLAASIRDVHAFVDHISASCGIPVEDIGVVGQSVGAVLVAAWAHDYAPRIRCMVLASPAFKVKLYVPFARIGLKVLHRIRGTFFVNSYVKSRFLTHDPERIRTFDADPLIARPIAVNILLALYETSERIVADARAITVPTQLLISGADFVVHHAPQHRFYERLGAAIKERHVLPGFFHDTLGERDRHVAVEKARGFLSARFAEPLNRPSLLSADCVGYTREEADTLASPLPLSSPRGLWWAAARSSIGVGALFSDGLRVGRQTGFDSGSMLDYVYRNTPSGRSSLGRLVDRIFLNAIGWRGIRQRKAHLEELLCTALQQLQRRAMPVRVLDIAAGHGRYVLDALAATPVVPVSVLLRDYSDINVESGMQLIRTRGLEGIARFVKGDAFDRTDLAAIQPKPTVGIVSGLYELFPDNKMVFGSLVGLAEAIQPDGFLIYTCQPWHPQLELIARALTSHRLGQPWVMRRRTQAEMDELVAAAGFKKLDQYVDEWGIFSVSVAERIA